MGRAWESNLQPQEGKSRGNYQGGVAEEGLHKQNAGGKDGGVSQRARSGECFSKMGMHSTDLGRKKTVIKKARKR